MGQLLLLGHLVCLNLRGLHELGVFRKRAETLPSTRTVRE
jgi:hypothetical protein